MVRIIGITGTIGSGKSTVGNTLRSMEVPVIDTDHLVHQLLSEPGTTRDLVVQRFGPTTQNTNGSINRAELGKLVFQDDNARQDLENIVHPAVFIEMSRQISTFSDRPVVAVLIPLLFEVSAEKYFTEIWAVITAEDILYDRLKQRDKLSEEEIKQRLSAQLPQEQKAARAHHVIDNSGTVENTRQQVKALLANS